MIELKLRLPLAAVTGLEPAGVEVLPGCSLSSQAAAREAGQLTVELQLLTEIAGD